MEAMLIDSEEERHPGRWHLAATLWADGRCRRDLCFSSVGMTLRRSLLTSKFRLASPVGNSIDTYRTRH
jgi:hypothetical protein